MTYSQLTASDFTAETALRTYDRLAKKFSDDPFVLPDVEGGICDYIQAGIGGASFYVSMGELIDSYLTEEFTQYTVNSSKVLDILSKGDYALIKTRVIIKPIKVGYKAEDLNDDGIPYDDANFTITGGRHRLTALLTAYHLSGVDTESEAFRSIKVRVEPELYSLAAIECDNGSRSMTTGERQVLKAQRNNVDVDDVDSIIEAVAGRTITKSDGFSLLFQYNLNTQDDEAPAIDLAPNTIGIIGSRFINHLARTDKSQTARLKDVEHVAKVLELAWAQLPKALKAVEKKGITNVALNGVNPIAEALSAHVASKTKVKAKTSKAKTSKGDTTTSHPEALEGDATASHPEAPDAVDVPTIIES